MKIKNFIHKIAPWFKPYISAKEQLRHLVGRKDSYLLFDDYDRVYLKTILYIGT